ncbi:WD40/YVTN/BNR-like repeat-containing protein [Arsenicibacter rosenii]|uniref:Exo-alpha-sialidase n=1 Tax=Arsenicibacter rosenii TaxID=1750698 RepID=A0A1S2VNR9_9BACT|nr:hypothetical protein [Arsenicibacter rosenii]OIN60409.1 hypothetical protein BLX24_06190 [Arsenicibacter rosenii]
MYRFFCYAMLFLAFSCQKPDPDTISPEYPDWYTIKAPVDEEIFGVWGDYDNTLLISTITSVFRSTDQGKNWQKVAQPTASVFGFLMYRDTLFAFDGLLTRNGLAQSLTNASRFSTDDGVTWQPYRRYNPDLDAFEKASPSPLAVNPVRSTSGTEYAINRVYLDPPTQATRRFETPGIIAQTNRRIDLPQLHQLRSLYLDRQQRLYIAGTDAVCGRGHAGENFFFCNSKSGRGVVYISKRPQP